MLPFGPHIYGAELRINTPYCFDLHHPIVVDIETDEKDNFVGVGMTQDGKVIHYYSELRDDVKAALEAYWIVGHNVKFDLKLIKRWGINLKSSQLYYDTCLASYVHNTTKESHGLKDLAKEFLGLEWPTYKDMVGTGKKKVTLDKQEVEKVGAYCGMDCLATYRLYELFKTKLTPNENRYLQAIELPTSRVLLDMELKGAAVDVDYLEHLQGVYVEYLADISKGIQSHWKEEEPLNINSNVQIAKLLESQGCVLPTTAKGNKKVDKQTLAAFKGLPVVDQLLEYSKMEKLISTYIEPLLEKNINGRIYASFNQISRNEKKETYGISTGRLSSSSPNLQNIPTKSDEGNLVRKAFIAGDAGTLLVGADYSQIEPRLVAHFSKDPLFIESYRQGKDLYQELVEGTGRSRNDGKTFMLALLYGAQAKKLANVFKCSEEEAEDIVNGIMSKLPHVTAWINRTKYEARRKRGVYTLFRRWIPLPKIVSLDYYERIHYERAAINYTIQGSAAEIMKLSLINLRKAGYIPSLTVHDEVLIEAPTEEAEKAAREVEGIMTSIVSLDVPLVVEARIGNNWQEVK